MRQVGATEVEALLDPASLVEALAAAFAAGATVPPRHHHAIAHPEGAEATLLLMPAWRSGGHFGVKLATVFPTNGSRGLPAVMGLYILGSALTGEPLALLDGPMLTVRRTAAASALAARHLARADARRMVMVGTGALAPHLIEAHAAVRPLAEVLVWGRDAAKAAALAARLDRPGLRVAAAADLRSAVEGADLVSCATLSAEPLVRGDWLAPGAHLDLVGGYTPQMRETDDAAIRRASVFVDTREGATREAGDIVQPLRSGLLTPEAIQADLFALCRGEHGGRATPSEITLFKSVGHALEDLAAAELLLQRLPAAG